MHDAEAMQAHEARLTNVERRQDRLDDTLQRLADDMHQLAVASAQQAEDRAALKRAFTAIGRLTDRFEALERTLQDQREEELRKETARAQTALNQVQADRRRLAWLILSVGLAAAVGVVLAHFGIAMVPR